MGNDVSRFTIPTTDDRCHCISNNEHDGGILFYLQLYGVQRWLTCCGVIDIGEGETEDEGEMGEPEILLS
jgi:hypothetical protein